MQLNFLQSTRTEHATYAASVNEKFNTDQDIILTLEKRFTDPRNPKEAHTMPT